MDNFGNFLKAASVIKNCRTNDQLDCCENWISIINLDGTDFVELLDLIEEMRERLKRQEELGILDSVDFGSIEERQEARQIYKEFKNQVDIAIEEDRLFKTEIIDE